MARRVGEVTALAVDGHAIPVAGQVAGFDYITGKWVAYTPKEWRQKYPASQFTRATTGAKGETWYRALGSGHLVAEAYGIIPKGVARASA